MAFIMRAKRICSSTEALTVELCNVKEMFRKNGYPISYLNNVFDSCLSSLSNSTNGGSVQSEREEFKYILQIPFVGGVSHDFGNKIKTLFQNEFNVILRPVYSGFKIKTYFNLKGETPSFLASNVVYKFTCLRDANMFYIGKTKRHLRTRAMEHLSRWSGCKSEVKTHLESCSPCRAAKEEDFKILKSCRNDFETRVHEAFLIKKYNPKLNKQLYNKGSFFTIKVF